MHLNGEASPKKKRETYCTGGPRNKETANEILLRTDVEGLLIDDCRGLEGMKLQINLKMLK